MQTLLMADVAALMKLLDQLGLSGLFNTGLNYVTTKGPELLASCASAAAVFYVGRWAAKLADRLMGQFLASAKIDETLARFLSRIIYAFMMCAVVLASLDRLGVNTTSVTAVLAAAGLAVGMALQGSLSNFAAGVMIILFRPFKVGDFVEAAGTKGIVEEINVFNTMLSTPDNIDIIVPNSSITSGNITNYSSKPTRRIDLVVGCAYSDDLQAVKRFLETVVQEDRRILRNPAPVVAVSELADHSVNFVVRPWVKNTEYWDVRWALTERIKLGFDEYGFQIPFPQRDVHVYSMDEEASANKANESAKESAGSKLPSAAQRLFQTEPEGLQRPRRVA